MAFQKDLITLREMFHSGVDVIAGMPVAAAMLRRALPSFSLSMIRVDARCVPQTHYSEFFDDESHRLFGQMGHLAAALEGDPASFSHLLRRPGRPYGSLIDNPPDYLRGTTYQMLFQRNGIHHCLDVAIRDGTRPLGILGIFRERNTPAFTRKDVAVIDALYPHLVHAFAAEAVPADYDEIDSALLIADLDGRIQWASSEARAWLARAGGAADWIDLMDHGVLPRACRELCRAWERGRNARSGAQAPAPTLTLPLPGGRLRLRAYGLSQASGTPTQVGIQMALEMSRPLRIQRVLESSPLSPQQRRIAFAMTQGATNAQLREMLNLSAETLRSYQKDLYARLDVNGAPALVQRLQDMAQRITLDLGRHAPRD